MCQKTVIILMYIIHTLMSVPRYVRIERGSYGFHDFKLNKVPLYCRKPVNINVLRPAVPKLALVPASCYYCDTN